MIALLLRVLGREHAAPVRTALVLMVVTAVVEGLSWALLARALEAVVSADPAAATPWLVAFAAVVVAYTLLRFVSDLTGFRVGTSLLHGVYHRLGDHLARLPIGWYSAGRVGEVSVLAGRGVLEAMSVIAHLLAPGVRACVTPATTVVVLLVLDWRLGLAALLVAPLVVLAQIWSRRSAEDADAARAAREREAADRLVEYLHAQPTLRASGRSADRLESLDRALSRLAVAARRSVRTTLPAAVGTSVAAQTAFVGVLVVGAHRAVGGELSTGALLAALVVAARGLEPLLELAELGGRLRSARAQLALLDEVLATEPLPLAAAPLRPAGHRLTLDAVSLHRGGRAVVDEVSLTVPEGTRLAVVGPSGAGKSTLLHLVARFHDVDSGSIRVGGVDVRDLSPKTLQSQVAIVFQDVYLFDASIEDNVLLARPGASRADLLEASRAARLDEVVDRLPDGWRTHVGEGGAHLSGGERQRVSIARALLKDSPIVLLDEITSALDPVTEAEVHDGIERLVPGRTVVVVAHRLTTVTGADLIAVLADGRLVELGTHEELLAAHGRYTELWAAQTVPAFQ